MKTLGLVFSILFSLALPALAADDIREERVRFKSGAEDATLKGRLAGRETLDDVLRNLGWVAGYYLRESSYQP